MNSKKNNITFAVSQKVSLISKTREMESCFIKRRKQQLLVAIIISTFVYFFLNVLIKSQETCASKRTNQVMRDFKNETTYWLLEGIKRVRNLPNSPYIIKTQKNGPQFLGIASCANFPTIFDIRFSDAVWQTQVASYWTFQIFGAYLDNRKQNSSDLNSIRVLGVIDRNVPILSAYCQMWFPSRKEPVISRVTNFNYLFYGESKGASTDNQFLPLLWKCPIPKNISEIPASVSIVENACDNATNNVKVNYEDVPFGKKEKIAVCVKGLDSLKEDIAIELIEWIETLKIFGVNKIFFYNFYVPPKAKMVLEYYVNNGDIDVSPITFPYAIPNERHLRNYFINVVGEKNDQKILSLKLTLEAIPYNDCLYRNMNKYEYLAAMDIDELFVPNITASLPDMLRQLEEKYPNENVTHFSYKNTIFLLEKTMSCEEARKLGIPDKFSKLNSITRGCEEVPLAVKWGKSIFRPAKVFSVLNHYPLRCLFEECDGVIVDQSIGKLHHYRTGFLEHKFCPTNDSIKDMSLWRWKKEIIDNSVLTMKKLNM